MDDPLASERAAAPVGLPFNLLLRLAMQHGFGRSQALRPRGQSWLVNQLAPTVGIHERSMFLWRTGRQFPSPRNFLKLLEILFEGEPRGDEWRSAFLAAYPYRERLPASFLNSPDFIQSIIPQQSSRVFLFEKRADKIALADDVPPSSQTFTDDQCEIYRELKQEAERLIDRCPPSSNRYIELRNTLSRYVDALNSDIRKFHRSVLWHAGRDIRRLHVADQRRFAGSDVEDPPYEPEHGAALESLVVLHNTFCSMDPKLADLDRRGADPALQVAKKSLEAARTFVETTAATPDLFDREVPETLSALIQESGADDVASRRTSEIGIESTRNVTVLLLRESVNEVRDTATVTNAFAKSFWGTSGKLVAGGVATGILCTATAFVVTYQAEILSFAASIPGGALLRTIVEWIVKVAT